jgi:hypothetical protein
MSGRFPELEEGGRAVALAREFDALNAQDDGDDDGEMQSFTNGGSGEGDTGERAEQDKSASLAELKRELAMHGMNRHRRDRR